jgi:hypothetical protein
MHVHVSGLRRQGVCGCWECLKFFGKKLSDQGRLVLTNANRGRGWPLFLDVWQSK